MLCGLLHLLHGHRLQQKFPLHSRRRSCLPAPEEGHRRNAIHYCAKALITLWTQISCIIQFGDCI